MLRRTLPQVEHSFFLYHTSRRLRFTQDSTDGILQPLPALKVEHTGTALGKTQPLPAPHQHASPSEDSSVHSGSTLERQLFLYCKSAWKHCLGYIKPLPPPCKQCQLSTVPRQHQGCSTCVVVVAASTCMFQGHPTRTSTPRTA